MREIKFRAKMSKTREWVVGSLIRQQMRGYKDSYCVLILDNVFTSNKIVAVDQDTVGQFTGLTDINGREIYEGDIVEYYSTDIYCINPDCEPHVRGYGLRLCKRIKTVMFDEGIFYVDNTFTTVPLAHEGIQVEDIDELKNDPYFDANGYDLDDVIGFEVIGNMFDNLELLEKGGEQ